MVSLRSMFGRAARREVGEVVRAVKARGAMVEGLESRRLFAVFTVTSLADAAGDAGSLRSVISAVNSDTTAAAHTIAFASNVRGKITLSRGVLEITRTSGAVSITGPGAGALTIDGAGASQIFRIPGASNVSFSGLTLANGKTSTTYSSLVGGRLVVTAAGGAIGAPNGGNLSISGVTFTGNQSYNGGAVNMSFGTLNISNSVFSNNVSTPTLDPFSDPPDEPMFGNGGAVGFMNVVGTNSITGSTFTGNSSSGVGGAVYGSSFGGVLNLDRNTYTSNRAGTYGGAIAIFGLRTVISNGTFTSNSSVTGIGKSIYVSGGATLTLKTSNLTVSGARASNDLLADAGTTLLTK
jgi:hypothetical protein